MPASMSARRPRVDAVGGVVVELLAGGDLGRHVGEQVADRLVLPDRHAERLPFLGVAQRVVERRPGDADRPAGDLDPAGLEPGHHLAEALALDAAEQGVARHVAVVEVQLARLDALVPELRQIT